MWHVIDPTINDAEEEIMVYNEHYVEEVFYTNQKQPGIFSLSKENKEAKRKIDDAQEQLKKIRTQLHKKEEEWPAIQQAWNREYQAYIDRIWEIERTYTGGDRVLDYCLEGHKRGKEALFIYLTSLQKPASVPSSIIPLRRINRSVMRRRYGMYHNCSCQLRRCWLMRSCRCRLVRA